MAFNKIIWTAVGADLSALSGRYDVRIKKIKVHYLFQVMHEE
jgi:hypothetical protein